MKISKIINKFSYFTVALFIIGISAFIGSLWGHDLEWNTDKLTINNLDNRSFYPKPWQYLKPPLVSYFHYYFSEVPIKKIGVITRMPEVLVMQTTLIWSRAIAAGLYVLSVILFYLLVSRFVHRPLYAKIITIVFGSSAGLIAYAHFLTADIPLMLCMLCSLLLIHNASLKPTTTNFVLAGFVSGVTSAVKYNGLILVVPLLLALLFSFFDRIKQTKKII
jgi:4-amino-4-deoxy-L-arabinose transferase-like glycosyltransferase